MILVGIVKVFTRMRCGGFDEAALEEHLNHRGFMNRFCAMTRAGVRGRC